ncbi:hypothetical protein GCM10020358_29900 [Amorphoplanes nipponensis]|uniref:hypothetical protein n=1 Tax=Actinoplanes nipponensis TaxID=135950 RepID=UPI0031E76E6D
MRPLVLDFPADPAVTHLDRQYLLGDSLLVAPGVQRGGGHVLHYVPARPLDPVPHREVVEGPGWVHETHGFASVPLLMVRPDSVVPVGARTDRPDYDYTATASRCGCTSWPRAPAARSWPGRRRGSRPRRSR